MKEDSTATRQKLYWRSAVFLFLSSVFADQFTKQSAGHVFRNYQFAFSLPLPAWLMFSLYFIILFGIIYYAAKNYQSFSLKQWLAWSLILAGALCNIIERLVLGYVRDFIYITFYRWVGIYNCADFFIIAGIIILLLQPFGRQENPKN